MAEHMTDAHEKYETFAQQRIALAGLIGECAKMVSVLNLGQMREKLESLRTKVENDTFKIMVVGTFKNGKSTFINSLLGDNVLPAYSIPTTAVINEVKYGQKKKAVLYFRDPLPKVLPKELEPRALAHMRRHNMTHVPPLEVPYDEIEDYVVIPMGKDAKEMLLESPYEKVELFWPLDLLKNGVVIIDSPGLNEHATRTRVTMEYLTKVDAILMVLNAQALCSEKEMEFIVNDLKGQGFSDPFFPVNRFDCIPKREREMVKNFASLKLRDYTSFGNGGIFFVSAQNALDGKLEQDAALFQSSGMGEFEEQLSRFLTQGKGKIKLAQPARELKRILDQEILYKSIPMQRSMLHTDLNEVKRRYESVQPKLQELKVRKGQLFNKLMLQVEQSKSEIRRVATRNIREMIAQVPVWASEAELTTKLGIIPNKEKTNAAAKEILDAISQKSTQYQSEWRTQVLAPIIEEQASKIFGAAETDVEKILGAIDQINVEIAGNSFECNPVPTWQRVVGAAGGLVIGDIGVATSGAINGLSKEFAATLAMEVGVGATLMLLGLFNPITWMGVLVGMFLLNWKQGTKNAGKKLKENVATQVVQELEKGAEESVNRIVDSVSAKFEDLIWKIVSALDSEIQEVEQQAQGIIQEIEKGQEGVNYRERVLNECESKSKELSLRLDELIFQLVKG